MATVVESPSQSERAIPNYRQQVRKALPDHLLKSSASNLWWYPLHAGIIGASWFVIANYFSWWMAPLFAIVIGHSFGCMGFIAHDILHGGSIQNKFLRDLFSGIGFSPFWISPRLWRRWHNADHHGHTQIEGIDPDHLFTMDAYKNNPILRFLYRLSPLLRNLIIFGSFSFRMTQQTLRMVVVYLRSSRPGAWEKLVILSQTILAPALWIGASVSLGSNVLIWGYLAPLVFANAMVIAYIATNHFLNPLADESDVLGTSLSVTLPRGLGWLDPWHQYFGAHVAHHLFPQAPAHHARLIDAKVAELFPDRFHCMPITRALKLLWDTPWVYEDHVTLIDPVRDERHKTLGHGMKND